MSWFNKVKEMVNNENKEVKSKSPDKKVTEIFDFLNVKKYKEEIALLELENTTLKNEFTDIEKMTALQLKKDIINKEKKVDDLTSEIVKLNEKISNRNEQLQKIESQLISVSEDLEMESFSLYKPKYDFATALGYKDKLTAIRKDQKLMIKNKTATNHSENWTVDGSKAKGRKMTNDNIKQILRSFNNECEAAINKVKFRNIDTIRKRINRSYEQLNKLNTSNTVNISYPYLQLKLQELDLAFEYERKKEEEKEILREEREKQREEKKLQKEIQSKKKIIDKDITHYQQMVSELQNKIATLEDEFQKENLNKEINALLENIKIKESEKEELDYREAHSSAGYVYVISNIGSLGENIVKIGVTRRLNPYDRITELSSASLPFKYDVHAMIFSYEAYQLESTLHEKFDSKRINKMNMRKEFFNISIEEIREALEEYKDLTIDFTEIPDAEEYRESLKILEMNN